MFYHANSEVLDKFEGAYFPGTEKLELLQQPGTRKLILNVLMHSADISNTCKPWKICQPWADRVISEFFLQGDQEKELGLPLQPLNDRDKLNKPGSQVAFIELFSAPFTAVHVRIFSPLWEMSEFLHLNLQRWHAYRSMDNNMPNEKEQEATKRVQAICENLLEVTEQAQQQVRSSTKMRASLKSIDSGMDSALDSASTPNLREVADPSDGGSSERSSPCGPDTNMVAQTYSMDSRHTNAPSNKLTSTLRMFGSRLANPMGFRKHSSGSHGNGSSHQLPDIPAEVSVNHPVPQNRLRTTSNLGSTTATNNGDGPSVPVIREVRPPHAHHPHEVPSEESVPPGSAVEEPL